MRVKTGFTRRRNHKKLHKATSGFRMSKHKLVKVAKEALIHAGQYAFNGRRKKKGMIKETWITRINAGLSTFNISYSKFMNMLSKGKIELNRKMLAELVLNDPKAFKEIVDQVSK